MGNHENLKQSITEVIRTNGNQEITGAVLQSTLLTIISTVGANATFAGIATPTTNPGTPDGPVFWLASESGTYSNFGGVELQDGLSVLMWNGSWSSQQILSIDDVPTANSDNLVKSGGVQGELALGAVYDVSAKNPTAGVNNDGKFESLSALLGDANLDTLIPVSARKGGMSIKFIQSSDNKYVSYRLMADEFTTDTTQWVIAEEGVYVENPEFIYVKTDAEDKILWAIRTDGNIFYGAGVPPQVVNYINEKIAELSLDEYENIVAFLNDLEKGDKTLQDLLDEKVDKVEGKSLIDAEYAESVNYIDNPEFIEAKIDSNNRILEAITRSDGSKILPAGIDIDGTKVNTSKNSEFIRMWLDSKNRVILAVKKNADIYFGFGIPSQIAEYIDNLIGNIDSRVQEEVMDNLISGFSSFISQTDLLIDTIGISNFKEKVITVINPDKYSCWPRIGVVNNKLVCIYVKCLEHTDPHNGYGALHSSVSSNGVLWTPQITVIDTPNMRDGITGRGNDSDGNLLIINRVGFPSNPNTFNEIYKTSDGLNFEKISTIPSSSVLGHAGDIINIPTRGLASFFGTYPRNGVCSYGYILSQDNGVTWDRIVIEQDITQEETPMEMSGAYIGEGKILIVGRFEGSGSGHMWQLQSEDYGNTWSKVATNIAGNSNSPSMIYNSESDKIYLYIYNRSNGRLEYREVNTSDVWNNPSNWPAATNIAQGTTGQDAGNVSTVMFKGFQVAAYYSGNSVDTGIYSILK